MFDRKRGSQSQRLAPKKRPIILPWPMLNALVIQAKGRLDLPLRHVQGLNGSSPHPAAPALIM